MTEVLTYSDTHDYMTDEGDVLPLDRPELTPDAFEDDELALLADKEIVGASVSLRERAQVIGAVAARYGYINQAEGMNRAKDMPSLRPKIQQRLRWNIDAVADHMTKKGDLTFAAEKMMIAPLVQREALRAEGFLDADIDLAEQSVLTEVRNSVGQPVASVERQRAVKRANKTAHSSWKK